MKKLLLLAATAAISVAASAQVDMSVAKDITPSGYDFSQYKAGDSLVIAPNNGINNWNSLEMSDEQIAALDPNAKGLIIVNGSFSVSQYQKAVRVVDLGGEVGKVLAINLGGFSSFNELMKTLHEVDVPGKDSIIDKVGGLQWNFYTIPATTPRGTYLRTEWVINGYNPTASADILTISNLYNMTSSNNVTPSDDNYTAENPVKCDAFCLLDEEGDPVLDGEDNNIYDPTAWMTYTYDCKSTNTDDTDFSSAVKAKLWTDGGHVSEILFVKSLKFYDLTGAYTSTDDLILNKRQKEIKHMTPDPSKVVTAINYMKALQEMDVNGNTFSAASAAQIFTLDGRQVANVAAGQVATLPAGTYVAKIGKGSVKFAVK